MLVGFFGPANRAFATFTQAQFSQCMTATNNNFAECQRQSIASTGTGIPPILVPNGETPVPASGVCPPDHPRKIITPIGEAGTILTSCSNLPASGLSQEVPNVPDPSPDMVDGCGIKPWTWGSCIAKWLAEFTYETIFKLAALVLWLAGMILDFVIKFTIVDMAKHLKDITGINIAWKVIRDLMNLGFIFLLVYEAIKIIIDQSDVPKIKKFITGIVLASILINFSLFFTKVLIDASNVVTIGLYSAMIDNTDSNGAKIPGSCQTNIVGTTQPNCRPSVGGISVPFMRALNLSNFFSGQTFNVMVNNLRGNGNLLIFAVFGTILFLVVAFVFFAVASLFAVRYITLLILLVLSPIGYIGIALPWMKHYSDDWWESLRGQLLFAPTYMLMTWVVLTVMTSKGFISPSGNWAGLIANTNADGTPVTTADVTENLGLIFNFVIIIGFMLFSLTAAKKTASRGASAIGDSAKKLTAFTSAAAFGGGAWLGRTTVGNIGKRVSNSAWLQQIANRTDNKGFGKTVSGALGRAGLYTAQTARSASFDVRGATIPTNVIGDAIAGSVGRTRLGKKFGLDEVNIASIPVGSQISEQAGLGKPETKGVRELEAEKEKRQHDSATAAANELALAQAKRDVTAGATAKPGTTEGDAAIAKMKVALTKLTEKQTETLVANNKELLKSSEFANAISVKQLETLNKSEQLSEADKDKLNGKRFAAINEIADLGSSATTAQKEALETALSKMSDKETEILAGSNKKLLESQEFANSISVKQLEALTKSDQFTETEKGRLKENRFAEIAAINDPAKLAAAAAAEAVPEPLRTPAQKDAISVMDKAKKRIKGLADSEVEMIDPDYIKDPAFISQLRPAQIENIYKSSKFTTSQKNKLKEVRIEPLKNAITAGNAAHAASNIPAFDAAVVSAKAAAKRLGHKEILSLEPEERKTPVMAEVYNRELLKRMAPEMNVSEIPDLKAYILSMLPATDKTALWLNSLDGESSFS